MATKRLFRRRSLNGAVTDVQTRLSLLESRPVTTRLLDAAVSPSNLMGGGVGYAWLEPYLQTQLDDVITTANEAAVAASGVTMTYKTSVDPTVSRTITKHKLHFKIATITTSAPHGYMIGSSVTLNYTPDNATFEGEHLVTRVPSPTTFEFTLPSNINEIAETTVSGAVVTLNVRDGDFWLDPVNGNATFRWDANATPAAWVPSDLVNGKGDETATKTYSTKIRPSAITESISFVTISKGEVTVTATGHPFKDGDRLTVSGLSGAYVKANGDPVYVASFDTNTFTYKIQDTTVAASGAMSGTVKYHLINNDIWIDKNNVAWLWNAATSSFDRKQDTAADSGNKTYTSSIDPSVPLSLASYTSTDGTATFTLSGQHTFNVLSSVTIVCSTFPELDGDYVVTGVPSPSGLDGHGTTFQTQGEIEDSGGSIAISGTATLVLSDNDIWIDPTNNNYKQLWSTENAAWFPADASVTSSPSEGTPRLYQTTSDPSTASWTIDKAFVSKGTVRLLMLTSTTLKLEDRINVSGSGGGGIANSTTAIISEFTSVSSFKYKISNTTTSTPALGVSGGTVSYRILDGDEWIHPTTKERKVWTSGAWVLMTDPVATAAQGTATSALSTANGKNTVYHSTTLPDGATPTGDDATIEAYISGLSDPLTGQANTAGDIWFHYNASQIIISQWQGLGGTSWKRKKVGSLTIANIDAGKITTGYLSATAEISVGTPTTKSVVLSGSDAAVAFKDSSGNKFGALDPLFTGGVGSGVALGTYFNYATKTRASSIYFPKSTGASGENLVSSWYQSGVGSGIAEITLEVGESYYDYYPSAVVDARLILSTVYADSTPLTGTATDTNYLKIDSKGHVFSVAGTAVEWSGGIVPNFSTFSAGLRSGNVIIGTSTLGTRRIQSSSGDLAIGAATSADSFLLENLPSGVGQASGGFLLAQASGSDRVIRRRLGFSVGTATDTPSAGFTPSQGDIYLIHEA